MSPQIRTELRGTGRSEDHRLQEGQGVTPVPPESCQQTPRRVNWCKPNLERGGAWGTSPGECSCPCEAELFLRTGKCCKRPSHRRCPRARSSLRGAASQAAASTEREHGQVKRPCPVLQGGRAEAGWSRAPPARRRSGEPQRAAWAARTALPGPGGAGRQLQLDPAEPELQAKNNRLQPTVLI